MRALKSQDELQKLPDVLKKAQDSFRKSSELLALPNELEKVNDRSVLELEISAINHKQHQTHVLEAIQASIAIQDDMITKRLELIDPDIENWEEDVTELDIVVYDKNEVLLTFSFSFEEQDNELIVEWCKLEDTQIRSVIGVEVLADDTLEKLLESAVGWYIKKRWPNKDY